jgi:hypothetical protein
MAEERPGSIPEGEWQLPQLRVDVDGDWYDDDVQITHPGILSNLRVNLRRDAQGYYIQTRVRVPVAVEDVPWVVVRLVPREDRLHVWLNDGTDADVDPGTLRMGAGNVPYCPVKAGQFEARLSRPAAFQLLSLVHDDEGSGIGQLRLGGREYPLRRSA